MRIRVHMSNGLVGCQRETFIDVDDDCEDSDIEEMSRYALWDMIEWGWERVEKEES